MTGALLSYLFNLDQSNLCRERNERLRPVFQAVLPVPMQDHLLAAVERAVGSVGSVGSAASAAAGGEGTRRKRISTLQELLAAHPELEEVWVDATEQEVPKPHAQSTQGKARKAKAAVASFTVARAIVTPSKLKW